MRRTVSGTVLAAIVLLPALAMGQEADTPVVAVPAHDDREHVVEPPDMLAEFVVIEEEAPAPIGVDSFERPRWWRITVITNDEHYESPKLRHVSKAALDVPRRNAHSRSAGYVERRLAVLPAVIDKKPTRKPVVIRVR